MTTTEQMLREDISGSVEIKIVCWNILAHIHTHWDTPLHTGSSEACRCLETDVQRARRHVQAVRAIKRLVPDVALLQEVDSYFMPLAWQAWHGPLPCGERLDGYTPYRSYSDRGEGTVVLLKDETMKRDLRVPTSYIAANDKHGWKTGVVVHAHRLGHPTKPIAFGSIHLRWGAPEEAANLLRSATDACGHGRTILGGDFNTPLESLGTLDALLWDRSLVRLPTPDGTPTGMHSCKTIDHVYATPCVTLPLAATVGPLPAQATRGPWGETEHDGSDHAWLMMELLISD
jgi:endonuclease/exonuclease/phosphatase family metal-dependent hydrolase